MGSLAHILLSFIFINFVIAGTVFLLGYAYYNHLLIIPLENLINYLKKIFFCEKNKNK
jgi:hypothetical protein